MWADVQVPAHVLGEKTDEFERRTMDHVLVLSIPHHDTDEKNGAIIAVP